MITYYSTQKHLETGNYPQPQNNKVLEVKNFNEKTKIEKEDIMAFGYIKYEKPLIAAAARTYGFIIAQYEPEETNNKIETEQKQSDITSMTDEKIIQAAIEKIKNQQDGWNDVLKNFLLTQLSEDIQLAKGVLDPLKNLQTCNNHLGKWAKKKMEKQTAAFNIKKGNMIGCAIKSEEVFSEAIHYFTDVKEEPELKAKPIITKGTKQQSTKSIENRPTIPIEAPKTKKEKIEAEFACSLF